MLNKMRSLIVLVSWGFGEKMFDVDSGNPSSYTLKAAGNQDYQRELKHWVTGERFLFHNGFIE